MTRVFLRHSSDKFTLYTFDQLSERIGKAFATDTFLRSPDCQWSSVVDLNHPLSGREVYPLTSEGKILVSGGEIKQTLEPQPPYSHNEDSLKTSFNPDSLQVTDEQLARLAGGIKGVVDVLRDQFVDSGIPMDKAGPRKATKALIGGIYTKLFRLLEEGVLAYGRMHGHDLAKGITDDLKAKHPDGHWITVKEGKLAGRHMFISGGEIVHGGGSAHWAKKEEKLENIEEPTGQMAFYERTGAKRGTITPKQQELPGYAEEKQKAVLEQGATYGKADTKALIADKRFRDPALRAISESLRRGGDDPDNYTDKELGEIAETCLQTAPVKVDNLIVNPELMQFKTDVSGPAGVTEKLKGVKKWDKELGGTITLWRDPDGNLVVGNGHHRVDLAKRLGVKWLNATIYDSKDGYTASDVRRLAAENNIANGSASLPDAVKYLRETGYTAADLDNKGIPLSEGLARQAMNISQLSDALYQKYLKGGLGAKEAEVIGENLPHDAARQDIILNMLETNKFGKLTGEQFKHSLPQFMPSLERAMARAEQQEGIDTDSGGDSMFSFFDNDAELNDAVKLSGFHGKVRTALQKRARSILHVAAIPEKLDRKKAAEISKQLGFRVEKKEDLHQITTALRELDYRLENPEIDQVMPKLIDKIIEFKDAGTKNIDKWTVDESDIESLRKYFVDDYEKHKLLQNAA